MQDQPSIDAEPRLVLLGFVHDGCEPCREVGARLRALAERAPEICRVEVVDAARDPELVERHRVTEFPTLVFLKQGVELRRVHAGALPASTFDLLGGTAT